MHNFASNNNKTLGNAIRVINLKFNGKVPVYRQSHLQALRDRSKNILDSINRFQVGVQQVCNASSVSNYLCSDR